MLRLIYASRVAPLVRFEDAELIATASAKRNATNNVTGLLLYTPSHFVQVLEGEEPVVRETMRRISQDPRHSHMRVVADTVVNERLFGTWSMRATWAPEGRTSEQLDRIGATDALALLVQGLAEAVAGRSPRRL